MLRLHLSPGNMTGMVGTALYVSPEVQGNTKASYNQVRFSSLLQLITTHFGVYNIISPCVVASIRFYPFFFFVLFLESWPLQFGNHPLRDVIQADDHRGGAHLCSEPAACCTSIFKTGSNVSSSGLLNWLLTHLMYFHDAGAHLLSWGLYCIWAGNTG